MRGVSLWDTSSPSLEIWVPNSSCSLVFSHLIVQLDGMTKYLSLETPKKSLEMHTWRPSSSFLTFYMEWILHLLMYLSFPKERHVSCRHWIIFCLQVLFIYIGASSLWEGYHVSLFPSYGGIILCIYMMYAIFGGSWVLHPSMHLVLISLFQGGFFPWGIMAFSTLWEIIFHVLHCILYMVT